MKGRQLFFYGLILLIIAACGKEVVNEPNPNEPPPQLKEMLVTKITTVTDGFSIVRRFEYNTNGRLERIIVDHPGIPEKYYIEFTYDANNRLDQSSIYENKSGTKELIETRKYYYNAPGNIVADSAFKLSGEFISENQYSYDNQNRLLSSRKTDFANIRYDYGSSQNATKTNYKYPDWNEVVYARYNSFDKKKCVYFENKTFQAYNRAYRSRFEFHSFPNNPLRYQEARVITIPGVVTEYRDMTEDYQYNENDYPIKRTITETLSTGSKVIAEQWLEYKEK